MKGFDMASLYRPTVIRYVDSQGRQVPKGTAGAKRIREKSKTFRGRYRAADGKIRTVSLCDDLDAAETMLAEIAQRAKREARGDIDPFEVHRKRPLTDHLEDFRAFLDAKGNTAAHVALTLQRITAAFDGCKFTKLADLNGGRVAGWLADRRKGSLSIASSNHHLVAVKSFGHWLVKDRRSPENPFAHLSKLNEKVDVRHERRALTADELTRTIQAAERSVLRFRGLDGSTRAILYRLAAMTGLRANELGSLSPASFDLSADPPTITIEAGYSKRRREDVLPLHSDLAARLRQWLSERNQQSDDPRVILKLPNTAETKCERLFPGMWTNCAAEMLRLDLDAAGVAYSTDGGLADFHALRHTFVSNLVAGGVHPKLAQQLARHSTITLTMDRYSHVGLLDLNAALESLPSIATTDANECRATGTTDTTVNRSDLSCTKSCNASAEISRLQPLLPVLLPTKGVPNQKRKNPQFPEENEGFLCDGEKASVGVEPTRDGFAIRCLSHLATTPSAGGM